MLTTGWVAIGPGAIVVTPDYASAQAALMDMLEALELDGRARDDDLYLPVQVAAARQEVTQLAPGQLAEYQLGGHTYSLSRCVF